MGIRKNMISNLLLSSSAIVFPLITFPYVTRILSANSIGKYFFIDALTQYLIIFSAVGIPYYGIREIAKVKNDAEQRSKLVVELLSIQIALAVFFAIVLLFTPYFIPTLKYDATLTKIACINVISSAFLMEWFYQGIENFAYITSRSIIIKILSVVSILLLVKQSNDYIIYYLLSTLVVVFNSGLNLYNYLRNHHQPIKSNLSFKKHLKPLLVLFSINVAVSIYAILDTIILGLLTNSTTVSYYNVPLKLVKIFWMVVNGAGMVLIPRIASYFLNNDKHQIENIIQKSLNIVFLLTIPFCCFCMMFANEILAIISGKQYLVAANGLRILSVLPFIIAICNVCGTQFLMPIGQENKILHATLLGLIISLSLNFLLIPHLGFIGSAIACVAAETMVCLYVVVSALKRIKLNIDYQLLVHILLSLCVSIAARFILRSYFTGITLIISDLLIYAIVFVFLQLIFFKNIFIFSLVKISKTRI
ncbi:flippase [Mucilaginibacter limnophilus]|uniref:Flippase n=1 Tax=Mucilaginibacter limnophilus TaxID=1932778 RepID=A0A3S2Y653_9SPHI|nr:flippase [Mucilaginibacter limnophilus]RVU03015.1 flippase [Mucilaginibacter limnophilus]